MFQLFVRYTFHTPSATPWGKSTLGTGRNQTKAEPGLHRPGGPRGHFFYSQKDERIGSIPKILGKEHVLGGKMSGLFPLRPPRHRGRDPLWRRLGLAGRGQEGPVTGQRPLCEPRPACRRGTQLRPGRCGRGQGAPGATQHPSVAPLVLRRIETPQAKTLSPPRTGGMGTHLPASPPARP